MFAEPVDPAASKCFAMPAAARRPRERPRRDEACGPRSSFTTAARARHRLARDSPPSSAPKTQPSAPDELPMTTRIRSPPTRRRKERRESNRSASASIAPRRPRAGSRAARLPDRHRHCVPRVFGSGFTFHFLHTRSVAVPRSTIDCTFSSEAFFFRTIGSCEILRRAARSRPSLAIDPPRCIHQRPAARPSASSESDLALGHGDPRCNGRDHVRHLRVNGSLCACGTRHFERLARSSRSRFPRSLPR